MIAICSLEVWQFPALSRHAERAARTNAARARAQARKPPAQTLDSRCDEILQLCSHPFVLCLPFNESRLRRVKTLERRALKPACL